MVTIKCVIIDDEPLAIELLEDYIGKIDNLQLMASFKNAMEAYSYIKTTQVDLLFLDIEMPGLTGIDFLKSMKKAPQVIITTAYREFALEGYELNVLDYLLKPFPFHRFMKAIDKVHLSKVSTSNDNTNQDYIFVKSDRKNQKVNFSSILYLESKKDYIKIVMPTKSIIVKEKIRNFTNILPQNKFLRVHRSYIVNLEKVTSFTKQDIEIGDIEIPIGATYKESSIICLKNNRVF